MKKIVFATHNPNKVKEMQQLLGDAYQFLSLDDIGCTEDIPETSPTIEGNALQKARYVYEKYNMSCFAEDTGLEVAALDGAPGVYTARYAGPAKDSQANMQKLLGALEGKESRKAQFRTVIALILAGEERTFEGIAPGHIAEAPMGAEGFGYDPIFIPAGERRSFAQMDMEEKASMSHRGKATRLFQRYLNRGKEL